MAIITIALAAAPTSTRMTSFTGIRIFNLCCCGISGFIVFDQNALQELAMPLLQKCKRLGFVNAMLQFLLDELKPCVIFLKDFAPRL
jgi:hypothetical protein